MIILKNKKILLLWALFALTQLQADEFRPYRPAIVAIGGTKSAIAALQNEIDKLESEAVGVPSLKEELAQAKAQLAGVKNNLGISYLEQQQAALKAQFDGFAQRFFKTAQVDDNFMYYLLNGKISDLQSNPEITRKLNKILQLKREIAEQLKEGIKDIVELGQQINLMTADDQRGLATIKTQLASIQQRITVQSLSENARSQLEPLQQKINLIQQKINDLLALRFTDDRLNMIARYKNRMRQYQLLLEYLRDPAIIPLTTEEQILATD